MQGELGIRKAENMTMDQNLIIKALQDRYHQFSGEKIESEDLKLLLPISQIRMFSKGEMIMGMRQKLTNTGFVLSGIVRSYYLDVEGNEITKNFHRDGWLIMDEGLLGYENSICVFEAIEDATIMFMNTEKLKQLVKTNETFKNIYFTCLEQGLRYKIYRESEFLLKNATERYLQFCNDYPELEERVKQTYISTYLGITPESLSRIRKSLKDENR